MLYYANSISCNVISGIAVIVVVDNDPIILLWTKISEVNSALENNEVRLTNLTAVSATRSHYAS